MCYRCSIKRTLVIYHMPKHLSELYQASLKEKEKNMKANFAYQNENRETNFVYQDDNFDHGLVDTTHLDVANFFENFEGRKY
ncbi:hypothetical protein Pint_20905 [Pistacia integerrima]|uniref:Uncharacterized protein n=1 Tax=Pistacia integerrima TaxID=434235 RepID=A0ACC0XE99_9ROSI|nr:hypothetical protein Pint_20905 [Pistacia integerrima]